MQDNTAIRDLLLMRVKEKIEQEIENITDHKFLDNLYIAPVVWYLNTKMLTDNFQFFSDFAKSYGKSESLKVKATGFSTYVKTADNKFIFGEASSIVSNFRF
jgi:hypothetical protein